METEPDIRWRCLRARPKCEHLAAGHLAAAGFESFCPRLRHQKATARGRVWFVEAMFPGYLFSRFARESVRHVRSLPFVTQLLEFAEDLGAVPDSVIADLRSAVPDQDVVTIQTAPRPGDEVEVASGPLRGSTAIVSRILPGAERVRILLEFIGGMQELEVSLASLLGFRDPRQEALGLSA